ncbi:unnamed protein product [Sympodiomycopsis kandeliae]
MPSSPSSSPSPSHKDTLSEGRGEMRSAEHSTYPPPGATTSPSNGSSGLWNRITGSRGITALTVNVSAPLKPSTTPLTGRKSTPPPTPKARWHTLEFKLYYLVFLFAVPLMIYIPIELSQSTNANYNKYKSHLTQGWIFGRQRDNSDFQYRSFRDYIPHLMGILILYCGISRLFTRSTTKRKGFLLGSAIVFVLALHGANTLKLILVLLANYLIAKVFAGRSYLAPLLIWSFNITTLAVVHWNDGFPWSHIVLAWLDDYNGLLPRWQINFNITMLRLISFSMDLHWSRQSVTRQGQQQQQQQLREQEVSIGMTDNRQRAKQSHSESDHNWSNYFIYICYPPLFIAGPIITFNDFISQLHNPTTTITFKSLQSYALRFLFSLLTMEFILHYMYVNAIKDSHAWKGSTPLELSMIGFWNLIIVWMKLLLPWRFFRLWALIDGIDPPENMIRCMANNYSTLGFWRSWHRSYNLWIVRYIYIPVGGSKNTYGLPATLLVFTFVALWHDLSLKLLTWGWVVTLFLIPELLARKLFPWKETTSHRHLAAFGGALNVLLMMTANLIGFAIGVDGIQYMWSQLLGTYTGVRFLISAIATLFVGVQVMFEYRNEELRRGISRKC